MRKIAFSAMTAIAALSAAPALAQSKTATTSVNAQVDQSCSISSASSSLTLTTQDAQVPGAFTYSCNFTGSPSVTIQSAKGGVQNAPGVDQRTVNYGVYLNDQAPSGGPSGWAQASTLTGAGVTYGPSTGFLTTAAPNLANNPSYYVGLTGTLDVAGTYSDTLTFTIAP